MISKNILAASAFVSLVTAIPLAQPPFQKRDVVWETQTEVALTTVPVTVTHWLEPGETAPSQNNKHYGHKGHGHGHGGHGQGQPPAQPETTQTAAAQPPPASSPESAPQAPAPSSYEQPSPPPAAPTTTQEAAPPAYTPEPQPTTQAQPTPQPQPSPEPAPSQPSSGGSGSSSPSGQEYTGDITHYDVAAGLGSCGEMHSNSEDVVAIAEAIMANPANPNANPKCGQTITISYGGQDHTAKVVDTCPGCTTDGIDLSPALFKKVAPNGDGRVGGVKWWFNSS